MAYTLTNEYVWKEIGNQVVVLHFDSGAYWTLNDTGTLIWKSVLDGKTVAEIADRLCADFSVAQDGAVNDVEEFLKSCVDKKMLLPG